MTKLVKARKHHICVACRQLIIPGEVYRYQHWAPWEVEDGDKDGKYYSAPACRWCANRIWKMLGPYGYWSEEILYDWLWEEMCYWLRKVDIEISWPDEVYQEPLKVAQQEAVKKIQNDLHN